MAVNAQRVPLPVVRAALCRLSGVIAAHEQGPDSPIIELWRRAEFGHLNRSRRSVAYGIVSEALVGMIQDSTDAKAVAWLAMNALQAYRIADVLNARELRDMLEWNLATCNCRQADRILGLGEECAECQARRVVSTAVALPTP